MSPASVVRSGGLFASPTRSDDKTRRSTSGGANNAPELPDPYADEPKWAAWKVTLFIILFCGAFWTGVAWLATRLFG